VTEVAGAGRRRRLLLAAVTLSVAAGFIDLTAVSVALPSIQRDFDISTTTTHWVVLGFLVTSASLVAAAGRFADIFGRRRVFLLGLGVFTLASVLCGVSTNEWWLIGARALQGVGSAALVPAGIALVTTGVPERERGMALGSVAAMATGGYVVGPVLGGIIVDHASWRWIFFINVPMALAIATLVLTAAAESRDERVRTIDYRGLALLTGGLTTIVIGVSRGPELGFASPMTVGLIGGGCVLLAGFLRHEARAREPLIRPEIMRHRHMIAASAVGFFSQFAAFSLVILGVTFVQKAFGLSAFLAGLVFLPRLLPELLFARRAGHIADVVGPTVPIGIGMAVIAAATAAVSVLADRSYLVLVVAFAAVGLGVAMVDAPRRVAAQSSVSREYQGVVAGISSTTTRLGATFGIAVLGSVIVAIQYGRSVHLLAQAGVRVNQGDRFTLDSVLANGNAGAGRLRQLSPQAAGPIRRAAHDAYTYAFSNSMRVAAVAVAVAGLVSVVLLSSRAEPVAAPGGRDG
jgi:EmrB/QacA subfamily drug resistance transporter